MAAVLAGRAQAFRAIATLRKICNHPDLVSDDLRTGSLEFSEDSATDDDNDARPHSGDFGAVTRAGKLLVLEQILPTWYKEGHRVLLFSQVLAFIQQREDGAALSRSRATPYCHVSRRHDEC